MVLREPASQAGRVGGIDSGELLPQEPQVEQVVPIEQG
jgi:hypothetical protein